MLLTYFPLCLVTSSLMSLAFGQQRYADASFLSVRGRRRGHASLNS